MRLALGIALQFHISVVKGSKLKVRKFWELIPMFVGKTGMRGPFGPILNEVKCSLSAFI